MKCPMMKGEQWNDYNRIRGSFTFNSSWLRRSIAMKLSSIIIIIITSYLDVALELIVLLFHQELPASVKWSILELEKWISRFGSGWQQLNQFTKCNNQLVHQKLVRILWQLLIVTNRVTSTKSSLSQVKKLISF